MIDTLPLFTPQNEFVSAALEQSTAFVGATAAAATVVPRRTQLRHTCGGTGGPSAASEPSLEYRTPP
ncbi:MAG: hypothetical protein DMD40_14235 [Gemmatimonadetes bacterium]|nr:MAG: hypothetical protein DMD40_14235 [Gemmatimonadota bacterium]